MVIDCQALFCGSENYWAIRIGRDGVGFCGLPPIGQKRRCSMDGAQFHFSRVGNGGGRLIGFEVDDGFQDGFGLGEDGVFEDGLVGDEGVHGADAADGGVKGVEELVADAGGDLSAVAPTEHVFVGDDHAAGFADAFGDGLPVIGIEGAEVEDLDVDALLLWLFARPARRGGRVRRM